MISSVLWRQALRVQQAGRRYPAPRVRSGGSRPAFAKAMAQSPAEIHAAAVRRLASISASATELARQGKLSSHEAGVLDHLIGIHGQRLELARPRR